MHQGRLGRGSMAGIGATERRQRGETNTDFSDSPAPGQRGPAVSEGSEGASVTFVFIAASLPDLR